MRVSTVLKFVLLLISCGNTVGCMVPAAMPEQSIPMAGKCLETKQDYWVNYFPDEVIAQCRRDRTCVGFFKSDALAANVYKYISPTSVDHERLPKGTKIQVIRWHAYSEWEFGNPYLTKKYSLKTKIDFETKYGDKLYGPAYEYFFFSKNDERMVPTWDKTKLKECES